MKNFARLVVASVASLFLVSNANAGLIDFTVKTDSHYGQTLSYAGGSAGLVGSNYLVSTVAGLGTPLNNNMTVNLFGGTLDFTTGNLVSSTANMLTFADGGTFNIRGEVPLGGGPIQNLFSGSMFGVTLTEVSPNAFQVVASGVRGTLNPAIANFYGIPSASNAIYSGGFTLLVQNQNSLLGDSFSTSDFASGNVGLGSAPTFNIPSVPEPSSVLLMGVGFASLGLVTLRNRRQVA